MTRTRFAPSPTGYLHIGGLRTAAYAYTLAKHEGGQFLLRIEDTDTKRSVAGAIDNIQKTLGLFGLKWDEFYVQSQRLPLYQKAAQELIASGHAYTDSGAIRLKVPPSGEIGYHDFVLKKDIVWKTDTLEDLVLLKSDGFPTYHLAVVVDDHEMQISHVLRGHDWLPSTPIHLLLYKFLDYPLPQIGHLTDILGPEGGKLSKRKGAASCEQLLGQGYLPEAILNWVILLGWAPKDNREIFTLDEFVKAFDINGLQKSNPVMNLVKLNWFNGQYIRKKSNQELVQLIKPHLPGVTLEIVGLIKDRITTLTQAKDLAGFFFTRPAPQPGLNQEFIREAHKTIAADGDLQQLAKSRGWPVGDFFMVLRQAICGNRVTPPLTESMLILGKDEVLTRLKQCLPKSQN